MRPGPEILSQELSVKSVRAAYVVTLSMIVLAVSAAPAAASTTVLASDKFKWFYWLGIIIAVGLVLWLLATLVGYYIRVLRPKHRGREVS